MSEATWASRSAVPRPQRTFQPRRRRLGPTRQQIYDRVGPAALLDVDGPPLDAAGAVLDIGFGYGTALVELAAADRQVPVIGVEVHTPGIAHVLEAIEREGLDHVRLVEGDVFEFLGRVIDGTVGAIRVWFPDPWPKARQRRRRMIRADAVEVFVAKLAVGGVLHLATDIADYAEQMEEVCRSHPRLDGGRVERPAWRPLTSYEQRGAAAGRAATDLIYVVR